MVTADADADGLDEFVTRSLPSVDDTMGLEMAESVLFETVASAVSKICLPPFFINIEESTG